ncbi:MAG: PQQ-binding-like beta-propeller repeat protein [Candidatus Dormibacteraeota bacterium]|nr:PQQ-binding-like beta-propeller repeat protein [Candidatus Dormibacteraeota bacterium]
MRRVRRLLVCTVLAALVMLTAVAADWPTFHGDNTRQGNDTADPGLSDPSHAWTSATLDGKVYGSPLVVGTQVIVGTENDTVYSLDSSTGAVSWSRHLGTPRTSNFPCGNINPLGITGTLVADGGYLYAAAEVQVNTTTFHFELFTLDLAGNLQGAGAIIDPPDPGFNANYQQQRGALLAQSGRIFVPLGGLDGDCGPYHGYVLSIPELGQAGSQHWWASTEVDGSNREGGIWAAGGLSADGSGNVYAATGNSNHGSSTDAYDYSDGVIKLPSTFSSDTADAPPADYFAPSTWYQDNAGDVDLGSTTPLQLPGNEAFIVGKSGAGYLLNDASLGHIGGEIASHQVCHATNDAAFGSLAYAAGWVYVGCSDGMAAVQVSSTGFSATPDWYNTSTAANRPPTVAGGLVWAVDTAGTGLVAFNATTGATVFGAGTFAFGGATHFATPAAAGGGIFVPANAVIYALSVPQPAAVNGFTMDAFGGVHHFGSVAGATSPQAPPSWPWEIARGLAVLPNHTGGYVVDGWGGVHAFGAAPALGQNGNYWLGWDIVRGIAIDGNGGGYLLDALGGVHNLGTAPAVEVTGYWSNWEIAVGLVLRSDGHSGWVLDGLGGLHGFGTAGDVPTTQGSAYWPNWTIARALVLSSDSGGYVLDGLGGLHPFGSAGAIASSSYWPGFDIARSVSLYQTSPAAGYLLDGYGGIHPVGAAVANPNPAYTPYQDVFRAVGVTS